MVTSYGLVLRLSLNSSEMPLGSVFCNRHLETELDLNLPRLCFLTRLAHRGCVSKLLLALSGRLAAVQ